MSTNPIPPVLLPLRPRILQKKKKKGGPVGGPVPANLRNLAGGVVGVRAVPLPAGGGEQVGSRRKGQAGGIVQHAQVGDGRGSVSRCRTSAVFLLFFSQCQAMLRTRRSSPNTYSTTPCF